MRRKKNNPRHDTVGWKLKLLIGGAIVFGLIVHEVKCKVLKRFDIHP